MRIDQPTGQSASLTGSFSGSFYGIGSFDGLAADSVEYANVLNKPALVSGSSQVVALVEAGTNSNTFTDADHTKLDNIEANADVTDTANVTAAGALMDSEVTNLAQVKAFDSSDYATAAQGGLADSAQQPPSEGAFVDGDKTKLDGIETGADVTDTTNVVAALTAGTNISIAGNGTISATDTNTQLSDEEVQDIVGGMVTGNSESGITVTYQDADGTLDFSVASQTDENFTTALKNKLDGIETSADVTDTANVTAAGALMDSEVTNLADVKAFDPADYATAAQGTAADNALPEADVDADIKTLSLPANTTISAFGKTLVDDPDAATARTTLGVDAAGTDNSTDVTLAGSLDYLTITGQTITRNAIDLAADVTGDLPVAAGGTGASTAAAARTNLGVDAAGTDNSTDVTLAGSRNYITISGQTITRNQIDISDDTNLAVSDTTGQTGINLTLSGDTISGVVSGLGTSANVQFNDLTVAGDLTVSGTTTSINSTNLDVTDKLIAVNRGGTTAASANGGGLFISGANESITWDNGSSRFNFSDDVHASGNITLTGTVDGRDIASDGTKLDGIESGADVTDTTNVVAALTAGTNISIAGNGTISSTDTNTQLSNEQVQDIVGGMVTGNSESGITVTYQDGDGTLDFSVASQTDENFTSALKTKLDGIATNANNYSLPEATATVRGGIELFSNTDQSVAANSVSSTAGRTYGIQLNSAGQAVVNVPWTDTNTNTFRTVTAGGNTLGSSETLAFTAGTNVTISESGGAVTINSSRATRDSLGIDTNDNVAFEGLMVGQSSGATANTIRCVGDVVAYYSSDRQFKDNIVTLDGALDKVKAIRGVRFDWNDKQDVHEGHDIGVVAQEVEEVLPELVHHRAHNDSKAVDYVKLTAVLIEAVKELSAKVDELSK